MGLLALAPSLHPMLWMQPAYGLAGFCLKEEVDSNSLWETRNSI
jgi:hypothetical protein